MASSWNPPLVLGYISLHLSSVFLKLDQLLKLKQLFCLYSTIISYVVLDNIFDSMFCFYILKAITVDTNLSYVSRNTIVERDLSYKRDRRKMETEGNE